MGASASVVIGRASGAAWRASGQALEMEMEMDMRMEMEMERETEGAGVAPVERAESRAVVEQSSSSPRSRSAALSSARWSGKVAKKGAGRSWKELG